MEKSSGISMHHASFLDFLKNPQRSSIFHIKLETRMNVAGAVLKALSDDACWQDNFWCVNLFLKCLFSHCLVCSDLDGKDFFECIASIPPSADLIPLIRGLNLDFIWRNFGFSPPQLARQIKQLLIWFKVSLTHECISRYLMAIDHSQCIKFSLSLKI
jgi:hypothetical protein